MKESPMKIKSAAFADRIVKMSRYLADSQQELIISKQIYRSGTSIGANISEAIFAASKRDMLSKMQISIKECSETLYWLDRLKKAEFITDKQFDSMQNDCLEIGRILSAAIKTTKINLGQQ
jgi:four helix bundle protein